MTYQHLIYISSIVFLLASCNNNHDVPDNPATARSINQELNDRMSSRQKFRGVVLTNGKSGGTGFTDSTGLTKLFRSLALTIGNDTTIPITLQLSLAEKPYHFFHTTSSKVQAFFVPDSVKGYGTELKTFLTNRPQKSTVQKEVILPGKSYSVRIGMLFYTNLGMPEGFTNEEVFFRGLNRPDTMSQINKPGTNGLNLILGLALNGQSTYYTNIFCGQILFP